MSMLDSSVAAQRSLAGLCAQTPREFVGVAPGHTIALALTALDPAMRAPLGVDAHLDSLCVIGSRVAAAPQCFAADEAVKATDTSFIHLEMPRDTEGDAGPGTLLFLGAQTAADAVRACELTLAGVRDATMGNVFTNPAGHVECQFSARAGEVLAGAFGAPRGQAFAIMVGAPAPVGIIMADAAAKAAAIEVTQMLSPAHGISYSNEVITFFTGATSAVHTAVLVGREAGLCALGALEPSCAPKPAGTPTL